MNLRGLRWLAIILPVLFLVLLEWLRHEVFFEELHDFPGVLLLLAFAALGVGAFSFAIFGTIERLEARVLDQNRHLSALNRIAAASAENLELGELCSVALDNVLAVMGIEAGAVCLLDVGSNELVAACSQGLSGELTQRIQRQKLETAPVGAEVVHTGRPVVREDLLQSPNVSEAARREGFRSSISVPLKSEGEVSGVLALVSKRPRRFSPDEIDLLTSIGGQLGLAVRNAMLYTRSQQRNRELAALLAVSEAATSSLELDQVLDEALDAVLAVTTAEAAEIWLMEDSGELALHRHRGAAPEAFYERTRFEVGEGLPGLAAQTGSPVVVHELGADARFLRQQVKDLGFQTFCALPLRHGDQTVGVLAVAARPSEALSSAAEHRLLEGIGEQLAIAVENAQLHQRVLDVAVLEERERIARELHDGLAQVLGYINTETLAVKKLIASGRPADAERELSAMEAAAKQVYADVREAILGLRASSAQPGQLIPSLRDYLSYYSEMAGVPVSLSAAGEVEALRLPATIEIQLMRVIQEALSNVRKHAHATKATVSFQRTADGLTIEVSDDGQGFDPERLVRTGWPRFGLQTMRERAQAIGGECDIISSPGHGTRVILQVPLRRSEA